MTLDDIQIAVLKQFAPPPKGKFSGESDAQHEKRVGELHILAVSKELECSQNLALMVFVAIARLYAFDRRDVIDFLMVDKYQYNELINTYDNLLEKSFELLAAGALRPESKVGKIYNKTCLVRNFLNINVPVVPRSCF